MNKINFKVIVLWLLLKVHLVWYQHMAHLKACVAQSWIFKWCNCSRTTKDWQNETEERVFEEDMEKQRLLLSAWYGQVLGLPSRGGWGQRCHHAGVRWVLLRPPGLANLNNKLVIVWNHEGAQGGSFVLYCSLYFFSFALLFCHVQP